MSTEDYLNDLRITGDQIEIVKSSEAAVPVTNESIETICTICSGVNGRHFESCSKFVATKTINKDEERQQKWYASGVRAKKNGYSDLSPFYENKTADYFFKCGYDGTSFVDAQSYLKEKIQEILLSNPVVKEVVEELTGENKIDHLYVPQEE